MSIFADIVAGIKLTKELRNCGDIEREKVALLLEQISECAEKFVESVRNKGSLSAGFLSEFATYCKNFERVAGSKLKEETRDKLNTLIKTMMWKDDFLYHSKAMKVLLGDHAPLNRPLEVEDVQEVIKASGELRAYANLLRAGRGL